MMKSKMMASGGMMKKGYASGGMPMVMKDGEKVPAFAADGKGKMAGGGMAKSKMMAGGGMMKSKMMASGGSASKRADGIAIKGKTKGTMLKHGGKVK
jgi:hypothetical protein